MPPIEKGRELWFLAVFLVQYAGGLALLYFAGIQAGRLTFAEAAALTAPLIIMSTAHSVVLVEGIAMLAESFLKRRYQEGRQEGREEGRQEGREEGRQEGVQEGREEGRQEGVQEGIQVGQRNTQQRWEEWNRRRMDAEAKGEKFEEPPPKE